MRRVDCKRCGVTVEAVPWASGKMQTTYALTWFLASWAKVLSWKETARRFRTSWDTVYRSVEHAVRWGLEHRNLDGVRSIGVDELSWKVGQKYLTLVYQIDLGCRRLLWIGENRTAKTFNRFFDMLGEERSKALEFIASDMWKAFLSVVAKRAGCGSIGAGDRKVGEAVGPFRTASHSMQRDGQGGGVNGRGAGYGQVANTNQPEPRPCPSQHKPHRRSTYSTEPAKNWRG
jgi:transposase